MEKGIVVVKKEDLVECLESVPSDACWTAEGWNALFDKLMVSMIIVED